MQGADYIIVGVVAVSVILGVVRGFVREAVALLSWLIGIWVAWRFSGFLHPYLGGALESPEQKAWAARVIILVLVLLAGALIGAILGWVTNTAAGLSILDRVLGFVFGLTRGALLVGVGVMVGHALELHGESWWKRATLMPYAEYVGDWLEDYAGQTRALAQRALTSDARLTGLDRERS